MKLEWKEEYSLGIETIDNQHKKLLGMINALSDLRVTDDLREVSMKVINDMKEYTIYHFKTEEEYFEKFNYEDKDAHKKIHDAFVAKIGDFADELSKTPDEDIIQFTYKLLDYLQDWLIDHIMGTDRKYAELFKENGVV